jgi:hypothetical protein
VRRSKYNAKPTFNAEGVRFASKAEAKRDEELLILFGAGKITGLKRQPRFPLKVNGVKICTYVADWRYLEGNYDVVEDRKGVLTPAFKIKWALAKALYPEIEWRLS